MHLKCLFLGFVRSQQAHTPRLLPASGFPFLDQQGWEGLSWVGAVRADDRALAVTPLLKAEGRTFLRVVQRPGSPCLHLNVSSQEAPLAQTLKQENERRLLPANRNLLR